MKRLTLVFFALLLANFAASAQLKKHRWETAACSFEGTYNARKYTAAQLRNTLLMWNSQAFDLDTFDATAFKIEDIAKLKPIAALEADYRRKSEELKKLDIVNAPYWTELKKRKLKALARELELARASVLAYEKPAVLKDLSFAESCVARFAPPLTAGGDSLLNFWREINEESRRKNSDPERVRREYETRLASADRFKYAQVEIITFGWWNCVNRFIDRGDDYAASEKNYRQLFQKVRTLECEEP